MGARKYSHQSSYSTSMQRGSNARWCVRDQRRIAPSLWPARSILRRGHGRRFHLYNVSEQIRLPADSLQMWITIPAVIVDSVRLKKIFILDEQFDRLDSVLCLPDRSVEIVRAPPPAIHRN